MLIQKYYYQTNQKKYTHSNLPKVMPKVLDKLHSKQEEEKDDQGLMLRFGGGCLHQLNLEIVQLIYTK